MLDNVQTSKQAWDTLSKRHANKTHARIMNLNKWLTRYSKGTHSMDEHLHVIKSLPDKLVIINSPLDNEDLVIHTINIFGVEY